MGSFTYEFTLLSNDCPAKKYSPWFVSPTNLHCSQTGICFCKPCFRLFPLRIYTALKPYAMPESSLAVCFPYEFTLLSNSPVAMLPIHKFVSPTNLHCSQTTLKRTMMHWKFVSPTNLHCSQTDGQRMREYQ